MIKILPPQSWLDQNSSKYPNGTVVSKVMMGYAEYYYKKKTQHEKN